MQASWQRNNTQWETVWHWTQLTHQNCSIKYHWTKCSFTSTDGLHLYSRPFQGPGDFYVYWLGCCLNWSLWFSPQYFELYCISLSTETNGSTLIISFVEIRWNQVKNLACVLSGMFWDRHMFVYISGIWNTNTKITTHSILYWSPRMHFQAKDLCRCSTA